MAASEYFTYFPVKPGWHHDHKWLWFSRHCGGLRGEHAGFAGGLSAAAIEECGERADEFFIVHELEHELVCVGAGDGVSTGLGDSDGVCEWDSEHGEFGQCECAGADGDDVDGSEDGDEWVSVFIHEQRGSSLWSFCEHECGIALKQLDGVGWAGGGCAGAVSVYGCDGDKWGGKVLFGESAVEKVESVEWRYWLIVDG